VSSHAGLELLDVRNRRLRYASPTVNNILSLRDLALGKPIAAVLRGIIKQH